MPTTNDLPPECLAPPSSGKQLARDLAFCLLAGFIALAWCWLVLDLRHAHLGVPIYYTNPFACVGMSDQFGYFEIVKGLSENGSVLVNPSVGMPTGQDLHDFPLLDTLHYVILRAMSWLVSDYAALVNIYYVLSFPLAAMAGYVAARLVRTQQLASVAVGVLFACLPYHFLRGQSHLFLATYYQVPFCALLCIWGWTSESLLLGHKTPLAGRRIGTVILAILIGTGGVYYALFTASLLGMAALVHAAGRRWRKALDSVLTAGLICVTILAIAAPFILHRIQAGPNPDAMVRSPGQNEVYGLKIVQLLLPAIGHRIPAFASLADSYARNTPTLNENTTASLGLLGSLGFLTLLAWLLGIRPRTQRSELFDALAKINIAAVLFAVSGGLGMLVSLVGVAVLRSSNRMSLFIAYFSLLALFWLVEPWRDSIGAKMGRTAYPCLLVVLMALGLWDQTNSTFRPNHTANLAQFNRDHDFVARIERSVPKGASILQLPYFSYPETTHEPFRAYLHSTSLKWSFGAMRGREGDRIQQGLAKAFETPTFVQATKNAGFSGVWLDRFLQPDEEVFTWLKANIDAQPLCTEDGRFAFFAIK